MPSSSCSASAWCGGFFLPATITFHHGLPPLCCPVGRRPCCPLLRARGAARTHLRRPLIRSVCLASPFLCLCRTAAVRPLMLTRVPGAVLISGASTGIGRDAAFAVARKGECAVRVSGAFAHRAQDTPCLPACARRPTSAACLRRAARLQTLTHVSVLSRSFWM